MERVPRRDSHQKTPAFAVDANVTRRSRPGFSDRPDQPETAAKQNDEEDHLPEERDPGLKQGARFLTILADRYWSRIRHRLTIDHPAAAGHISSSASSARTPDRRRRRSHPCYLRLGESLAQAEFHTRARDGHGARRAACEVRFEIPHQIAGRDVQCPRWSSCCCRRKG